MVKASPDDGIRSHATSRLGKTILLADASFLLVVGCIQQLFELLSHFFGIGLWAKTFLHSPFTIGFFEAHGLAVLIAIMLYRAAFFAKKGFWHLCAMLVHGLLGGANLLFWTSFIHFNIVPMGIIVTGAHGFFALAQGTCFILARRSSHTYSGE
jgi:phosphoglycerol transferase MdoB-like AlkP superfamily enzyme